MTKKLIVLLAALIILVTGTSSILGCYEKADSLAKEDSLEIIRYNIASDLEYNTSLRTLPYALKAEVIGEDDALNVLMDVKTEDAVAMQRIKGVFGTYYGYWKSHIYEYVNVHSYVKDLKTGKTNGTHLELAEMNDEQLQKQYQIVLKLNYDSFGNLILTDYDQVDVNWLAQFDEGAKAEIEQYMRVEVKETLDGAENLFEMSLKPITDMEMIIAVPVELEQGDLLYSAGQVYLDYIFSRYLAVFAIMICVIVFGISLFLPLSVYREVEWVKRLLNIKFEILAVLETLGLIPGMALILTIAAHTVDGGIQELITEFQMEQWMNEITLLLNGGLWFVYLAMVMFAAMMIRWIWNKGLFRYLKENTCVAWVIGLIVLMVRGIVGLFEKIFSFDLKNPVNQLVVKIVGINFIVVVVLCCIFPAGIFLAALYSAALFFFLKAKLTSIQKDYLKVLETTRTLSAGNFNVSIEENVGVFTSLKDALGTLKKGFQHAVNEEVKSQRMKSELITNVSHDLKTPLTSIITYVDLLKNSTNEEERSQYIETIDRNSHRLKHLIEDLFEVSKATSGNVSLNLVDVDLISLIRQVELECEEKITEKNLEFRLQTPVDKLMLKLDSAKAFRIFENLMLNICKYALKGTRVFVNVEPNHQSVRLIFKNISESELEFDPHEITERFVQGDKSRNAQGSGLGLAIVKSFTELHGGSFHVETDGDLFKAIVELPM
ncbi:MAG: HAMP domain-containing histidine kinase [Erysipelotrichaceae bacterium]|nr:HAMP domain-containing histidine kinase [Erysipelotrichaceae bacterium]